MADLRAFQLPFGGFALEPLTDEGQAFIDEFEWEDASFRHPDGCMAGLPESAVGYEPWLMAEAVAEMKERGLTWCN